MNAGSQTAIMQRLFAHYGSLRSECSDLPALELVVVSHAKEPPVRAGARPNGGAWARVAAVAQEYEHGWVRRRSGVWMSDVHPAEDLSAMDKGPPLWGEWASDDDSSVHLRPDPEAPDLLRFHRIAESRHKAGSEVPQDKALVLCERIHVLREPITTVDHSSTRVLLYNVYWGGTKHDSYGIRRLFSRFAGFGSIGDSAAAVN